MRAGLEQPRARRLLENVYSRNIIKTLDLLQAKVANGIEQRAKEGFGSCYTVVGPLAEKGQQGRVGKEEVTRKGAAFLVQIGVEGLGADLDLFLDVFEK